MKFLLCVLFFLAFFYSSRAQERFLKVTSGGGVAGIATQYKIGLDGQVLRGKGLGEISYTEAAKLKKFQARKYFKQANSILASHPDFNHPGNLYFSILTYNQGKESQITWGDSEYEAPDDAEKLYQKISKALTGLAFVPDMGK